MNPVASKADENGMGHTPILYVLTEADRRGLSASFGVDLAKVPTRVTGGEIDEHKSGVMFVEMINFYRIALNFAGRPRLAAAASRALAQLDRIARNKAKAKPAKKSAGPAVQKPGRRVA